MFLRNSRIQPQNFHLRSPLKHNPRGYGVHNTDIPIPIPSFFLLSLIVYALQPSSIQSLNIIPPLTHILSNPQ